MVIQLHGQTAHVVALAGQKARRHRAVHAAGHGYDDSHGVNSRLHRFTSERSFSTTEGSFASSASTWVSSLPAPRLKRIEFCVRCVGSPIARSTRAGSSVPDEQAEAVD